MVYQKLLTGRMFYRRTCSMLRLLLEARIQGYKERGNEKVTFSLTVSGLGFLITLVFF